jgi:hypothetical protein
MGSLPFCGSKYISSNLKRSHHRKWKASSKNIYVFLLGKEEKIRKKEKSKKKLTAYRHLVFQSLHNTVQQLHCPPASWEGNECYLKYTQFTINQSSKETERGICETTASLIQFSNERLITNKNHENHDIYYTFFLHKNIWMVEKYIMKPLLVNGMMKFSQSQYIYVSWKPSDSSLAT